MLLLRWVTIVGARPNLHSHGRECVMQAGLEQIVLRQAFAGALGQFRRARRKIACFLMYGDLPGLRREQSYQ